MRPASLAMAAALFMPVFPAAAQDVAALESSRSFSPVGSWEVESGESRFKVSYCGAEKALCAKLVWLREDARTDDNLALLNKLVVNGAEVADRNVWTGEVSFSGSTYAGTVKMLSPDSMKLTGCNGMLCKSFELTRL